MAVAQYKVNCTMCQRARTDGEFRQRIYHAYFFREDGDETLRSIAGDLGIRAPSLYNHMKKHVRINPAKAPKQVETHIVKLKTKLQKEAELAIDHDEVIMKEDYERVVDGVLAEGLDQMKKQKKQISISQLLAAAKIKADYSMKRRGQDAELIKTMYRLATGPKDVNGTNEGNTTKADGGVDSSGPERPGDIHKQTPRYALARGAEEVPQGNP